MTPGFRRWNPGPFQARRPPLDLPGNWVLFDPRPDARGARRVRNLPKIYPAYFSLPPEPTQESRAPRAVLLIRRSDDYSVTDGNRWFGFLWCGKMQSKSACA